MGVIQSILNALGLNSQNSEEFGSLDHNRISWSPNPVRPGETIQINYQGLLKDLGASEVYLHYGFDSWSSPPQTVKMEQRETGEFGADVQAEGNHEINFCFKDAANQWDNNNGSNWTLPLE
jgi:hypothetical protein